MFRLCPDNIPKILDLVNKTQFRNLRMFRTLSDNLAHKLVYSDFLDFVVIITECLFDRNKLMLGVNKYNLISSDI
jgi:hypothetical protein